MVHNKTLSIYLFKLYCRYFIAISLILIGILAFSNAFDILQKFKNINISSQFFWKLVLYKIPYLFNEIAALISFISMLFFLRRLTKYNELVIILCAGTSIRKIIMIPAIAAVILGVIIVAIINPIGTYGLQKYEYLEDKLTKKKQSGFIVLQKGILFFEEYNDTNRIVQAGSINIESKELQDITILFIDSDNNFLKRIDAKKAVLSDGNFELIESKILTDNGTEEYEKLIIPSNLSINSFTERLIMPEMISVWKLPSSVQKLLKSGLPVLNYQIYYYKQLFKPLLMLGTIILASCFISLRQRDNSQSKILVSGLFVGFVVYSSIEVALRILAYNNLSPILAILLPISLMILISNFVVLHLHEA